HGTGTIVGDSIECLAISRAFREYTEKKQFCALGTVKTNIGHTGPASGIAGILKLLLALKHRQIPPCLHFENGNPAIDFKNNPFYVNNRLQDWKVEEKQRRRGAVSSFGFSGTNAHLVIEEAPEVAEAERTVVERPGYLVVLSARTREQLEQQAEQLVGMLKRESGLALNDLSFTLLVGRMHLGWRLGCVARNQGELVQLLEQWLATGAANQVYAGEIQDSRVRENVSLKKFGNYCIRECRSAGEGEADSAGYLENLAAVAELYVKGYLLDYRGLFGEGSRRMSLPTYPFARERYWVESDGEPRTSTQSAAAKPQLSHRATAPNLTPPANGNGFALQRGAPLNDTEKQLVEIWSEVLNIEPEKIGVDANLFELGGHSLLATQLM
ncbi:MAG TPA: ketoacyl-synthetase C-terminal extension domain-containing protein, partial [Candidatus Sulfotelmatobacter sp.]|nr:ketoacyl-synthetase C-terminal extension domain-containing protein [Candidatus Sulfotelmatobacter sp.]